MLVWVGLGGLEMDCEWLARLVWEGLGIMTASSKRCMVTLSESCMEWNGANSTLAVHFDLFFLSIFSKFRSSHSCLIAFVS